MNRPDFVTFLEMIVTIMSLIVSFSGLIFVETTRSIIETSEPVRNLSVQLENKRLKLESRLEEVAAGRRDEALAGGKDVQAEKKQIEDRLERIAKGQESNRESLTGYRGRQRGGFQSFIVALTFSALSIIEAMFLIVEPPSLTIFLPASAFTFASVINFGALMIRFYAQSSSEIDSSPSAVLLPDMY